MKALLELILQRNLTSEAHDKQMDSGKELGSAGRGVMGCFINKM